MSAGIGSCMVWLVVAALVGCGRGERSDAGPRVVDSDAAAEAGVAPDAATSCPPTLPPIGSPCADPAESPCVYGSTGCGAGDTPGRRRCRCVDAGWVCACATGP